MISRADAAVLPSLGTIPQIFYVSCFATSHIASGVKADAWEWKIASWATAE